MTETKDFSEFTLDNIFQDGDVIDTELSIEKEETKEAEEKPEKEEKEIEKEEPEEKVEEKVEDKSKDEVEEVEENSEDVTAFYNMLNEEMGIDSNEVPKEYLEEGVPGIIKYLKDITSNTVESELEEIKSLGNGLLGDMYEYLKNGGKPEKFIKTYLEAPDYSSIKLEGEENAANQKYIIKQLLEKEGYDDEDIKDKIEGYEAAGIMEKEAKIGIKKLNKLQEKDKADLIKQTQLEQEQRKEQVKQYWDTVISTIENSDEIGGIPISKNKKQSFVKYLTEKGKDGFTQYEREVRSEKNSALKMAYAQFSKFNFDDIKTKAKTEATKDIKKVISKFTDTGSKLASKSKTKDEPDNNKTDFSKFKLPHFN